MKEMLAKNENFVGMQGFGMFVGFENTNKQKGNKNS